MKKRTTKIVAGVMATMLLLSGLLMFAGMAGAMAQVDMFSDIAYSPYKTAIEELAKRDIVGGYNDGSFKPNAPLNRAEFMKIVVGSLGKDLPASIYTNCFPDVRDEWYAPYVCYGNIYGVIDGYPDGYFRPEKNVNYAEGLKMVYRTYNDPGDDAALDEWYSQYSEDAKENGIFISGIGMGEDLTRGEMSQLMYNYMAKKILPYTEADFGDKDPMKTNPDKAAKDPDCDDATCPTENDPASNPAVCQVGVDCADEGSAPSSAPTQTAPSEDAVYTTYSNDDYGFEMKFDEKWKGFTTKVVPVNLGTTTVAVVKFQIPDLWDRAFPQGTTLDPTMLAITVREKEWKNIASQVLLDSIVGEDDTHVYTWTSAYAADSPSNYLDIPLSRLNSIVETFKLK